MCGITSWENKEFMSGIAPRIHSRNISLNWDAVQPENWSAALLDQLDICIHWRPVHDPKFMSWTWRGFQRVLDLERILKNLRRSELLQNYLGINSERQELPELFQNFQNYLRTNIKTTRTSWTSRIIEITEL